jgi:hypothetical protein
MEWDTRSASAALCRTGLDAADRTVTRDALQLSPDVELDPVSTPCPPPFVFLPSCLRYPSSFFLPSCAIARVAGVAVAAQVEAFKNFCKIFFDIFNLAMYVGVELGFEYC